MGFCVWKHSLFNLRLEWQLFVQASVAASYYWIFVLAGGYFEVETFFFLRCFDFVSIRSSLWIFQLNYLVFHIKFSMDACDFGDTFHFNDRLTELRYL